MYDLASGNCLSSLGSRIRKREKAQKSGMRHDSLDVLGYTKQHDLAVGRSHFTVCQEKKAQPRARKIIDVRHIKNQLLRASEDRPKLFPDLGSRLSVEAPFQFDDFDTVLLARLHFHGYLNSSDRAK